MSVGICFRSLVLALFSGLLFPVSVVCSLFSVICSFVCGFGFLPLIFGSHSLVFVAGVGFVIWFCSSCSLVCGFCDLVFGSLVRPKQRNHRIQFFALVRPKHQKRWKFFGRDFFGLWWPQTKESHEFFGLDFFGLWSPKTKETKSKAPQGITLVLCHYGVPVARVPVPVRPCARMDPSSCRTRSAACWARSATRGSGWGASDARCGT